MNNTKMTKRILERSESFDDYLLESLKDQEEAATYLQVALDEYQEDGDTEFFMKALRNVAKANGGVGQLAKKTDLPRQNLYHTLSSKGNPSLKKLSPILTGLGFHLFIAPIQQVQHA